ncbi:winged helix-turn helix protein [Yimella lutea]|uniref:Winged helix-turn helix protein n=1 Tax=Yimella lutea TaxID=587872 RepID=A0A542EBD6_9MICO|nr:winged helix-turn helix protein [Yimella lutea]
MQERLIDAAKTEGVSTRTLERWVLAYREGGVAGLAHSRTTGRYRSGVDPRWDEACLVVLADFTSRSTPTMNVVLDKIRQRLDEMHGPGEVPNPSKSTGYRRLTELSKGRHAFGSAKQRRSVARRPDGPYGRLRATRPGEYVVLDTTPLDVFAMEPVTLRWVPVELTVAQDLFTRCILGLRLTPISTTSADVANVLYQCVVPQRDASDDGHWPFHGVPRNLLVGTEEPDGVSQERLDGIPACLPEAIVVDHGKVYISSHVTSACARLGITIQPAIPYKPTDKPTVERFFRTLREGLLQHLPAYKGPDVYNRGEDVEGKAFYYVSELEQIIREWVGTVYHRSKHDGLCVPEVPGAVFSPLEMFEVGLAKAGGLLVPTNPDLAFSFLEVAWRTIQHYGVEVDGRRYDGPGLNKYRNTKSPHGGLNAGKWPIFVDRHDVRNVWFQDPVTHEFSTLAWEHAPALDQPFSHEAAEYTKQLALRDNRHVDPLTAVTDLLLAWSQDEVSTRREKSLALRLSSSRPTNPPPAAQTTNASVPAIIDLLSAREQRQRQPSLVDDLDEVFERYCSEGDDGRLEVFDE